MANVRPTEQLQKLFEEFIEHSLKKKTPESLYQPMEYIMQIGGKRIRPLCLLSVADALNVNMEAALYAAYAIELFHNFSLMHDDIMDDADLRRAQASTHIKFGVNSAILSGDAMLIFSMQKLRTAEVLSSQNGLTDVFLESAMKICEGQALDMDFEKRAAVSLQEYLKMIEYKTAELLASSFKIAALLDGDKALADHLYALGIQIGIGFQLEDDWLDYFGDRMSVGKEWAGDLKQRKKSALVLVLSQALTDEKKSSFDQWYLTETDDHLLLIKMEELFVQYDVKNKLKSLIGFYQENCNKLVEELDTNKPLKDYLSEWVKTIFKRSY